MAVASVMARCLAVVIAVASPSSLVSAVVTPKKTNATVEIAPGVRLPFFNHGHSGNRSIWVEVGGRGLDTAFSYGDADQRDTGEVVAKSGVARSDLFVTTKVPCCPTTFRPGGCPYNVTETLAHDLEILGLKQVDLMLIHWPCSTIDETVATWKHLEEFLHQGKARAIGVSNFNSSQLEKLVPKVNIKPAVNQVGFSVGGHAKMETKYGRDDVTFATARKLGITLQAYSPLGGVSGVDVLHNPTVLDVARKLNRSGAEVALRWLVQKGIPLVTSTDKKSHAVSDLGVLNFELSEEEMQRLSAVQPSDNTVIEI